MFTPVLNVVFQFYFPSKCKAKKCEFILYFILLVHLKEDKVFLIYIFEGNLIFTLGQIFIYFEDKPL